MSKFLQQNNCGKLVENIKKNHVVVWQEAYGVLKSTLPDHAVHAWIDPIVCTGLDENILLLAVPNHFFKEWIESHYTNNIDAALKSNNGSGIKYQIFVSEKEENKKISNQSQNQVETKTRARINNLNPQYRFQNFIVGSNNELAKAASESVAKTPGDGSFNPLIIYGGVGLGKTHLMHAIGNRALVNSPTANIVNITSEKFTLDFVNSLRKNKTIEFAQNYRKADILLIDDIQFFRGKEQTQEQFFHTFNVLYQSGKQIVLTADKFPGEMKGLQSRLLSRFQSGLSVDIQPPDYEMRVAILLEKAEQNGLTLEYPMVEFIATHIKKNIRELEGAIIRILAKSSLLNKEIDKTLVFEVIKERVGSVQNKDLTIESIVKQVSLHSKISENDIVGKSRKMEVSKARQISMYICRNITDASLNNIGVYFGGRDHTTVMHAINNIEKKKLEDLRLKETISTIKKELSPPPF